MVSLGFRNLLVHPAGKLLADHSKLAKWTAAQAFRPQGTRDIYAIVCSKDSLHTLYSCQLCLFLPLVYLWLLLAEIYGLTVAGTQKKHGIGRSPDGTVQRFQ